MENPVPGEELASSPILGEGLERAKIRKENFEGLSGIAWEIVEEFGSSKTIERNGKSIKAVQFGIEIEDGWSLVISESTEREESSLTWLEILSTENKDLPGFTLAEISYKKQMVFDDSGNELSSEAMNELIARLQQMQRIAQHLYDI